MVSFFFHYPNELRTWAELLLGTRVYYKNVQSMWEGYQEVLEQHFEMI